MTKIGLLVKIEMYRAGNAGTQDVESAVDAYTEALLKQCIVSGALRKKLKESIDVLTVEGVKYERMKTKDVIDLLKYLQELAQ